MRQRSAFTLLELSVVLTIVGLVIGGVLTGQSMLNAQKLRNGLVEAGVIRTAMTQFEAKYGGLPGDLQDAARIWGQAEGGSVDADCTNSWHAVGAANSTCNGNGDGFISDYEGFRAFQQMSAAGFLIGQYTGTSALAGFNGSTFVPGQNVPAGAIRNSGYYITGYKVSVPPGPLSYGLFDENDTVEHWVPNFVVFGKYSPPYGAPSGSVISPPDALAMDAKADDGMPGTGSIRPFVGTCTTTNNYATARYDLTKSDPACTMIFYESYKAVAQ